MAQSRFMDKFLYWFASTTDAPMEFGVMAGLSALSTIALGRRWVDYTTPLHSNIFGMIVGDSGVARKGTSLLRGQAMVQAVEPERIGPNDYTSESLFQWMRQNKDPNTKKGREKIAIFADEFGADLARMTSYASTIKGDFCRLYDCVPINKVRMTGSIEIPKPRVTFMAACAYQMMIGGLNHNDWATGYLMRFMFVAPLTMRAKFVTPPDPQPALHDEAAVALEMIRDEIFRSHGGVRLSAEAKDIYAKSNAYHEYHAARSNEVVRTYVGRFWTNVLKFALLFQLDEEPLATEIGASAMRRACEYAIEVCWPSFLVTFEKTAMTSFANFVSVIAAIIIEAGPKGVMRSVIAQRFIGKRDLTDVINWFKINRLIKYPLVMRRDSTPDELLIWNSVNDMTTGV